MERETTTCMPNLPKSVKIGECWARDGIQAWPHFIPTDKKIELINSFTDLGFKRIEVTNFVDPRAVPQFADAEEVLKGIKRKSDATYIVGVLNDRALDRAIDATEKGYGPDEIWMLGSTFSRGQNLINLGRTVEEISEIGQKVIRRAIGEGFKVTAVLGTMYGCPLGGEVPPIPRIVDLCKRMVDLGVPIIMLGDTTGEANPFQVKQVISAILDEVPEANYIAHFHDTRGAGIANCVAALEMGITLFDTSFGSVGGQPAHHGPRYLKGLTGNTATEDLVCIFEDIGVDTGVSVDGVIRTAAIVEEVCGEKLYGKVTRGGGRTTRPRDEELAYDDMWEGKEFPPAFFYIDPEASAKYMEVMGDYDPLYTDDGVAKECGLGGAIVPPALAAIFLRESYLVGKKMPQGGIMAKMEIESVAPLRLKDALISYSKVLEKYERNERKYVVIGIETYNRAQELVVRGKIIGIWPH